jgi:Domain of unknown function (DUF4129)
MATRRNLSLAAALVVLVALVAIASSAHAPAGGGGGTRGVDSQLVYEFLLIGVLASFVLSLPVAAWVLLSTRGDSPPGRARRRRSFWNGAILFTVLMLVFAFAAARFHEKHHRKATTPTTPANLATGPQKPNKPGKPIPFDWLPAIVVLSVATAGAVVIGYVLFRRPANRKPTPAELAARLSSVLDDSLDDLLAEQDPRRAVIATYARMERTLAGAGCPRAVAEAPLEYLGRVLRDLLHTSAEAVSRLTALFERAKFSHHEIDAGMKDEAIEALVSVRDELRAVAL